jgi:hypothetical protein
MSVFTLGHRLGSRPLASAAEYMAPSSDLYARQVATHAWDGHTTDRIAARQECWRKIRSAWRSNNRKVERRKK